MTESNGKNHGATEERKNEQLEKAKTETLIHLLNTVKTFTDTDMAINRDLQQIISALAEHAKKNPGAVFSSGDNGDIVTLLTEFRKKHGGCGKGKGDINGNDIVGGFGLSEILKDILDFIATEKKFIIAILMLIFCRDTACGCLCDYIKTPDCCPKT